MTEYVFLQGKLSWVKCKVPNEWGKWTCRIHPDAASLEKVRVMQAKGVKNVLKQDDDGWSVNFSRPTSMTAKGKVIGMAPPEVLKADGTPLGDIGIGNGSDGTVKLETYMHNNPAGGGKAMAARLLAVRVDNLIPFEINRDFDSGQKEAVEGLAEQPQMVF